MAENPAKYIDPIKVREGKQRIETLTGSMGRGLQASGALLWFAEYARDNKPADVLRIKVELVASSTPGAKEAQHFIDQVASNYAEEILAKAVEQAVASYDNAERLQAKAFKRDDKA